MLTMIVMIMLMLIMMLMMMMIIRVQTIKLCTTLGDNDDHHDDENANDDDANGNAVNSWSEKFLPGKRELFLSLQLSPLSNGVEEEEFGEEEEEKLEFKDKAEQELSLPSLFNSFSSSQRRQGGGPWG